MKIKRYTEFINESKEYGTPNQVASWLNEMKIKNYTINEDLSVDVKGSVDLSYKELYEIPIKFNYISIDMYCNGNWLTSLKGIPQKIEKSLDCSNNSLSSLIYCPKYIGNNLWCEKNDLTSLEGLPINFNLKNLFCNNTDIKWNWLESILTNNESLITYHIEWIKSQKYIPDNFQEKFGYLLEFEHYTKIL